LQRAGVRNVCVAVQYGSIRPKRCINHDWMEPTPEMIEKWHRRFAVECNNRTWDLMDRPKPQLRPKTRRCSIPPTAGRLPLVESGKADQQRPRGCDPGARPCPARGRGVLRGATPSSLTFFESKTQRGLGCGLCPCREWPLPRLCLGDAICTPAL